MKICITSDHRGFELKQKLLNHLKNKYDITDLGPYTADMVDYTKYAFIIGENVRNQKYDFGIAICGTGIGISIACNKVKGIRCAKVNTKEEAILTRQDNDANIIALDAKKDIKSAIELVESFVNTEFSNIERHKRRVEEIKKYEDGEYSDQ